MLELQHIRRTTSWVPLRQLGSGLLTLPRYELGCHNTSLDFNPCQLLQMYISQSPRVCDCSLIFCTLLFSCPLSWIIRPVLSYRTIEFTHTVLPNLHIITPAVEILIASEALFNYLRGPLGHILTVWACMSSSIYWDGWALSAHIRATLSAHIRANPVSPYGSQSHQPVWELAR